MIRSIPVSEIDLDAPTQPRETLSQTAVNAYVAAMKRGDQFPPVVVYREPGGKLWLADGFHRVRAARKAGKTHVSAEVVHGTLREAQLYAAGANDAHGLRRTVADKRRAALALLQDPEWGQWSDSEIARCTRTSHTFVSRLRRKLESPPSEVQLRQCADGRTRDVARIGGNRQPAPENPRENSPDGQPPASGPLPPLPIWRPPAQGSSAEVVLQHLVAEIEPSFREGVFLTARERVFASYILGSLNRGLPPNPSAKPVRPFDPDEI